MRVSYQRAPWTYDVALPPWPIEEQRGALQLAFAVGFEACCAYITVVAYHIRSSLLRRAATPPQDADVRSLTTRGGDRQA